MRGWIIGLAVSALAVLADAPAGAQDQPDITYHALADTYGCSDPDATRKLTDPGETRGSGTVWFKSTFTAGRCVTITTRSPWRLVSIEGDVASMSYAGEVGPPGTYFLRLDQMIDLNGRHPGEIPNAGPTAGPAVGQAPRSSDSASPTALAPPDSVQPQPTANCPPPERAKLPIPIWLETLVAAWVVGFLMGRGTRDGKMR